MTETHYAVVENDTITNVVVCDDPDYAAEQGWQEVPENAWIGWTFDGDTWNPPPPPPPTVSQIYPPGGTPGTAVTIVGTNLDGTTKVLLGTFACANVTVVDDDTVACSTVAGPSKGARPITLTVDGEDIVGPNFVVT